MPGHAPPERRRAARPFGFGQTRRLGRRVDFERLLRDGRRQSIAGFTFYVGRRPEGGPPRLGILISKRHSALATVRNRIKRCIREAFRLEQGNLGAIDVLVRPPYGVPPGSEMIAKLRVMFSRLGR